ncbi:hypothetical protein FBU30_002703 [Linnemannia zychae]|nr:hypothetical protein FBU30_002703 [Linnemannia zychae]
MPRQQDLIIRIAALPTLSRFYLNQNDLTRCVCVCRAWHTAFIPSLWHTFSDGVSGTLWTQNLHAAVGGESCSADSGQNVDWFLDVYRRHAKYIRRLTIHYPLILEALLTDGLRIPPDGPVTTVPSEKTKGDEETTTTGVMSLVTELEEAQANPEALSSIQTVSTRLEDGKILVLPSNVRKIEIEYENDGWCPPLDWKLSRPVYTHLEEAVLRYVTHISQLRNIFCQAPNLKILHLRDPNMTEPIREYINYHEEIEQREKAELLDKAQELATPASSVQIFCCEYLGEKCFWLERLFRLTPQLVQFYVMFWTPEFATTLAKHCPLLEVVRVQTARRYVPPGRTLVHKVYDCISPLLTSCPKLRILDIQYEMVDTRRVADKPWVCLDLEELHCGFLGVPHLSENEQKTLDRILIQEKKQGKIKNPDEPSLSTLLSGVTPLHTITTLRSEEEKAIYDRFNRATTVCKQVFGQLSRLTRLKILTINPSLKHCEFSDVDMYTLIYRSQKDGMHYINYHDVRPDSLRLRLYYGMGQLSTLKELEYFGFESMDGAGMEKEDVEWLAGQFPKLKEMRGLAMDTHVGIEANPDREALFEMYKTLRPDVTHTETPI